MPPEDLIQILRLANTGVVRERLEALYRSTRPSDRLVYNTIAEFFVSCKRATPNTVPL